MLRQSLAAGSVAVLLTGALGFGTAPVAAKKAAAESTNAPAASSTELLFAGVPVYSVMKTETALLTLSTTPVNAFAPIALPCPSSAGSNGCTVRVTVSSQFAEVAATDVVRMNLLITGPGTIGPGALVNVASNSSPSWPQAYTTQWVEKNIPAGSVPTFTLQFLMNANFSLVGSRTMSIDIFNGLL